MIIPEVRVVEIFGEDSDPIARVTFGNRIELHHENHLRLLLARYYQTYRIFSRPCIQVLGTVILFRPSQAPRFIAPDTEEMEQVLRGMNLLTRLPAQFVRKTTQSRPASLTERATARVLI